MSQEPILPIPPLSKRQAPGLSRRQFVFGLLAAGMSTARLPENRLFPDRWLSPVLLEKQGTLELRPGTPEEAGIERQQVEAADAVVRAGVGSIFPAAVLLVAQRGVVVLHRAYGNLDPEAGNQPAQLDSLFDLASISKLFTVTAFMTRVEADKVSLNQPVADVIPEFSGLGWLGTYDDPVLGKIADFGYFPQPIHREDVTFRHLLIHRSGLPSWLALYRLPNREAMLQAIYRSPFTYPVGERIVYSDLGLILLGEAVARLSGRPLDQAIRQHVLDPLGLHNTFYNPLSEQTPDGYSLRERIAATESTPASHGRRRGQVDDENALALGGVAGQAGLFCTAWDLAVLGQMGLNGGYYGSTRLLRPETVAAMTREQAAFRGVRRGLGWELKPDDEPSCGRFFSRNSYGHRGFTGTSIWIDPERELLVVCLTNRVYYGRDAEGILAFRPALHEALTQPVGKSRWEIDHGP